MSPRSIRATPRADTTDTTTATTTDTNITFPLRQDPPFSDAIQHAALVRALGETYYAHRHRSATRRFEHVYLSPIQTRMCGSEPVHAVRLREAAADDTPDLVGWLDFARGTLSLLYDSLTLLEICFTYGSAAEIDLGRGRIVRVMVQVVEDA